MTAWEANQRYEGYREAAREYALEMISGSLAALRSPMLAVAATAIDDDALRSWYASKDRWEFPWDEIAEHFRRNDPDRFEIAIWTADELCGLAIGRPSKGDDNVTLHFLERRSDHAALKGWIAQIATDAAESYGKLLGKQWVKLKDPRPGAIPHYRALRFALAETSGKTTYYARKIGR